MARPVNPYWRCRAGDDDPEQECQRERQGYTLYCPAHADWRESLGLDRHGPLVTPQLAEQLRIVVQAEMLRDSIKADPWEDEPYGYNRRRADRRRA